MKQLLYGAIEAGGTKFICAVGHGPEAIRVETRIPTTTPSETLGRVLAFFEQAQSAFGACDSLGVAAFGPIDLDRRSPAWGQLLATPKAGWAGTDLVGPLRERFSHDVALDTDVNAAALAELRHGAGRGLRSLAYVTVGTGIGGGAVVNGATLTGALHPEMGHLRVVRDARDVTFAAICPFHADCVEGLASGPAIQARWGASLDELPAGHEAFSILGNYLGQLAVSIALLLAPERIVFGGGVMTGGALLPHIHERVSALLNGYLPLKRVATSMEEYISAPGLADRAGLCGAFLLAQSACVRSFEPGLDELER